MSAAEIQAMQDEQEALTLHAGKQFDATTLGRQTLYALRRAKVNISAAGTIGGMTLKEADKLLDAIDPPLGNTDRMAAKLELRAKGILFAPKHA